MSSLFNFCILDKHFKYENQLNRIINAKKRIFLNNNKDNFKNIQNKDYLDNIYKLINGKGLTSEDTYSNSTGYLQYSRSYNILDSEHSELIEYFYPKLNEKCYNYIVKEYKYCYNNNKIIIGPLYNISSLQKNTSEDDDYKKEKRYLFLEEAILHLNKDYRNKIYKQISTILYFISFLGIILGFIFSDLSSINLIYHTAILALELFIASFALSNIITNNIMNKYIPRAYTSIESYTDNIITNLLNKYKSKFISIDTEETDESEVVDDNIEQFKDNIDKLRKNYNTIIKKKICEIKEIKLLMNIINDISEYIDNNNSFSSLLVSNTNINIKNINDVFEILIKNEKYKTKKSKDLKDLCIKNIIDFYEILKYNYEMILNDDKDSLIDHLKVIKINNNEYIKYINIKNN